MAQRIVYNIDTRVGFVTNVDYTTVPDSDDLNKKADKIYVSNLIDKTKELIAKEEETRAGEDNSIKTDIDSLRNSKADKKMVKEILSETNLALVRSAIEAILEKHLIKMHAAAAQHDNEIKTNLAAFREFSDTANQEISLLLQPIHDRLQLLDKTIDALRPGFHTIKQTQEEITAIRTALHLAAQEYQAFISCVWNNESGLKEFISNQIQALLPKIIDETEKRITPPKRKGFFKRLFS